MLLRRALAAEFFGTAFLLIAVVGSGIMAERLFDGNVGLALLANTIATGAALVALIGAFGAISGAHFNPAVSLMMTLEGELEKKRLFPYVGAQTLGALVGVASAHVMFNLPWMMRSTQVRFGVSQWISEAIATFGLLAVIWGTARARPTHVPFAVGAYITGAYWFTSSTSFANPAVTLARAFTATFSGIRLVDVPMFIVAQLLGAYGATRLYRWLSKTT